MSVYVVDNMVLVKQVTIVGFLPFYFLGSRAKRWGSILAGRPLVFDTDVVSYHIPK